MGILCPKCGTLNDEGDVFCFYCGAKLETPVSKPLRAQIVKKRKYEDLKVRTRRRPKKELGDPLAPYKGVGIVVLGFVCLIVAKLFLPLLIYGGKGSIWAFNLMLSTGFGCIAGGSMLIASIAWPSLEHRAAGVTLTFLFGPLTYLIYLAGSSEPEIRGYFLPFLGLTIIGIILIITGSEKLEKLAKDIMEGLAR